MISRFKWYKIRLPCSLEELISRLRTAEYTHTNTTGFLISNSEPSFRFIWPSTINTTFLDSEGNAEYQKVTTINSQLITILSNKDSFIFRFENPPRSVRDILNALEKTIGFGFACEQIIIDDKLVQDALEKVSTKTLNSLKISGTLPEAKALARLELASKEGIALEAANLANLINTIIEAASYEVTHKGLKGQIGFSRLASCKISGPLTPFILSNLESTLLARQQLT